MTQETEREAFEQIVRLTHKLEGPFLRDCRLIDTPYTYADPNTEAAWQLFKQARARVGKGEEQPLKLNH